MQQTIFFDTITTPAGKMIVGATDKGICLLEFAEMSQPGAAFLQKKLNGIVVQGENEHIRQVKTELEEYFGGNRKAFDVPLQPLGTAFQVSVWNSLLQIPYGTTTTYLKQALLLGNVKAVRAVAAANGQNKIAIIIPCHRIIGSNGSLTGYAGGLERKKWLLDFENRLAVKEIPLKCD
jgi:AraC family transcriptional regulator, regulatory protein of adaptative response / methylated-DNA-[protein]-cysteine methyltransferase